MDDATAGGATTAGAAAQQARVPRQRGPVEDGPPRRGAAGVPLRSWPAADHFADRNGLTTTQARLLLAVFCGTGPDHADGAPGR